MSSRKLFQKTLVALAVSGMLPAALSAHAAEAPNALAQQAKAVFQWGIGFVAVLAALAFLFGAVQYMASAGKPEAKKDASSRMLSAVLGLVLCVASVLALETINPSITKLDFGEPIGEQETGIYYSNGSDEEDLGAPFSNPDTDTVKNAGYKTLKYFCKKPIPAIAPRPVLVWLYPEKNLGHRNEDYSDVTVARLECGDTVPLSGKSFAAAYEYSGVYFFLKDGCQGFRSEAQTAPLSPIQNPFRGRIRSIKIINAEQDKTWYGAIFHAARDTGGAGQCSEPLSATAPGSGEENCINLGGLPTESVSIFNIARPYVSMPATATMNGAGANLFSKPWGWESGSFAGKYSALIQNDTAPASMTRAEAENFNPYKWEISLRPAQSTFTHVPCGILFGGNACETAAYRSKCQTFSQCPGSIQVIGKFLLALSTDGSYGQKGTRSSAVSTCQLFYGNINSVKEQEFMGMKNSIGSIKLIPLAQ